jgi:hypothetical protein
MVEPTWAVRQSHSWSVVNFGANISHGLDTMIKFGQSNRDMQFLCLWVRFSRWGTSINRGDVSVQEVETLETTMPRHLLLYLKYLHELFATHTMMAYSSKVIQRNVTVSRLQP